MRASNEDDWRTEPWDGDGYWQGPKDLEVFLRANAVFAAFWAVVLGADRVALIAAETSVHGWWALPFGVAAGGAAWLVFMFLFAHRLIAEGD